MDKVFVFIVAVEHLFIMILEMFFWDKPIGRKVFGLRLEEAKIQKKLAVNQGLYNGFLAFGLIWSLVHPNPSFSHELSFFFLGCVFIAGLVGAVTANKKILFIQGIPALIAMIFCLI